VAPHSHSFLAVIGAYRRDLAYDWWRDPTLRPLVLLAWGFGAIWLGVDASLDGTNDPLDWGLNLVSGGVGAGIFLAVLLWWPFLFVVPLTAVTYTALRWAQTVDGGTSTPYWLQRGGYDLVVEQFRERRPKAYRLASAVAWLIGLLELALLVIGLELLSKVPIVGRFAFFFLDVSAP
jgi:hypothetical protein